MSKFKSFFVGAAVALALTTTGCDQVHETWEQPEFVTGSDAGGDSDSGNAPECKPEECDDGNPCTVAICEDGKCAFPKKADGTPCDDGEICTIPDVCKDGTCKGVLGVCDDGNPCTADTCVYGFGCQSVPLVGTDCEDGNPCTSGDTCESGSCTSGGNTCECEADADCASKEDGNLCNGTLVCNSEGKCVVDSTTITPSCDDGDPCTKESCVPATGKCKTDLDPSMVGKACAEGKVCTQSGLCATPAPTQDSCEGKTCDDNNVCTADSCIDGVCLHKAISGSCNDGNLCTQNDSCIAGVCKGASVTCNDGNSCTIDSCDPSKGCAASAAPNGQSCDDGNAGTLGEVCTSGLCKAPIECQSDSHCNDGNVCNGEEKCIAGVCKPGNALDCNDGADCTTDSCDPKKGCLYVADDSKCSQGYCYAAKYEWSSNKAGCYECNPETSYDNAGYCNDNNVCTEDLCNSGFCVNKATSYAWYCDDGDPCTYSSSCKDGECKGKTMYCDDGDPSTTDYCDSASGVCKHTKVPTQNVGKVEVSLSGFAGTYKVHAYYQGAPAAGYVLSSNWIILDKASVCGSGVQFAVEGSVTNHWYGCNPGQPSLTTLTVKVNETLVTPGYKGKELSYMCFGSNTGEGNLYLSPSQLGCSN